MPISRNQNTVYVRRDIEDIIEKNLEKSNNKIFMIDGGGGVGKSTLLNYYIEHQKYKNIPLVFIDLKDTYDKNFAEILLRDHCTVTSPK